MLHKREKGFTLIELMIVVAIIGILAAIAIPRFGNLIKRSKEGATKGNLGALRSALAMYYGQFEGVYPVTIAALVSNEMMESIPTAKGIASHADGSGEEDYITGSLPGTLTNHTAAGTGAVEWGISTTAGTRASSVLFVNCNENDTVGTAIHTW